MDHGSVLKRHLAGFFIILMALLTACGITSDLSEITAEVSTHSLVFKSERGFGNDRFDIYSFSLKKPQDMSGFHPMSEKSEKFFLDYTTMIDAELMNDPSKETSLKAIKAGIDHIKNQEDGQYLHVSSHGRGKLYVYSPGLNIGYCLVLVI